MKLYMQPTDELNNPTIWQAIRFVLENDADIDTTFAAYEILNQIHGEYNKLIRESGVSNNYSISTIDDIDTIKKKCSLAKQNGIYYRPILEAYNLMGEDASLNPTNNVSGIDSDELSEENDPYDSPDYALSAFGRGAFRKKSLFKKPLTLKFVDIESGLKRDDADYDLGEAESSTERVKKYYKRHPEKVRAYLKKTVEDRVARNRDRKKAIEKYGKQKMKNHDVHHPSGPHNGNWRLAKKDHGPDKKNEGIVLSEGGASGHLAHPFEDEKLTFKDMKEMITRGLLGGLDAEAPVTEKLDGQNIAFSIRDGQIAFARNKGHVKNRGKNALDVAGIRNMFSGRGNIEKAFTAAAEDLQAAVGKLSSEQRQQMFGGGSKFMSLEIILPDTQNVIPYGKSVLVMHGTIEYDADGNEIGRSNTDGKEFADAVTAVGADKQKTFGLNGPKTIAFSDAETEKYQQKTEQYITRLDRAAAEFGLDENSTLEEYRRLWWEREITSQIESNGLELSEKEFNGLIERWADGSKKFGVKDIDDDETKKWFREFEKDSLVKMQKKMIKPIETTFLQAGTDSLRRVINFLSVNNPEASAQLKNDVLTAIKAIRDSNDPDAIGKLQRELERLESIGMDNVVPSEGVVFIYNGKPYKFTGQFAPINQIAGTFKFGMTPPAPKEEPKSEPTKQQPSSPQEPATPPRTVAIFTGRFQPFHAGHYSIYEALIKKFGKENVYIASSNKTDATNSPFKFSDRKDIMTRMFDIPEEMVVQVKNPYAPEEILDKLPDNTTYVTAVSQKDADRLNRGGTYFKPYDSDQETVGYKDAGYYMVAPEMQLTVNGKNISGTQLRAVMGDTSITDRAKQEIFTKVYGKFDKKIFNKIVKTTTESEEAVKLTKAHGKSATKEPVAKPKAKKPSEKSMKRAKSILTQRIKNPSTGRKIFIATALTYDKKDPVRIEAERRMKQAMAVKESYLTENTESKKMKVYVYVRDYTKDELENEVGEYFENERTIEAFPDMADSADELKKLILMAPSEVLTADELKELTNSDVPDILSGKNPKEILKRIANNKKDVKGILTAIKLHEKLPEPVVIKHSNGYYLMGGNTRLSALAAMRHTMPVKVIQYGAPMVGSIPTTAEKSKGKNKGNKKELFQKILQMRITNSETGNQIKIDTAMDYDRFHPAHKVAMNVMRQQMKGLSNRAGIPKNRTD